MDSWKSFKKNTFITYYKDERHNTVIIMSKLIIKCHDKIMQKIYILIFCKNYGRWILSENVKKINIKKVTWGFLDCLPTLKE